MGATAPQKNAGHGPGRPRALNLLGKTAAAGTANKVSQSITGDFRRGGIAIAQDIRKAGPNGD